MGGSKGLEICKIENGQSYEPTVIALGNFDGVHLGHQKLFKHGLEQAKSLNVGFSVLLFNPHPLKVLIPNRSLNLLTSLDDRLLLFEKMGVDIVYLFPFSMDFAHTSPREFVELLLKINVVHIVVGFNYSFGSQGKGSPVDLSLFGKEYDFGVSVIQAQKISGRVISSTEIRKFLLNGDIDTAKEMMGRSPRISGKVIHGDARGRNIGYPTANIQINEDLLIPKDGVYAVTSEIDGKIFGGMMNIGVRPTFKNDLQRTVEVFFFDLNQDLYGKELLINIEARLRPERKFGNLEEIILQLKKDKEEAICVLSPIIKYTLDTI